MLKIVQFECCLVHLPIESLSCECLLFIIVIYLSLFPLFSLFSLFSISLFSDTLQGVCALVWLICRKDFHLRMNLSTRTHMVWICCIVYVIDVCVCLYQEWCIGQVSILLLYFSLLSYLFLSSSPLPLFLSSSLPLLSLSIYIPIIAYLFNTQGRVGDATYAGDGDTVVMEADLRSSDPSQRTLHWLVKGEQQTIFIKGVPLHVQFAVRIS